MKLQSLVSLKVAALLLTAMFTGMQTLAANVPFKGALEGAYTSIPGQNPTTLSASGQATHVGRFNYTFIAQVSPDASTAFGTVQFIATNGDKIFGQFIGDTTSIDLPLIWIEEDITITGGTGRFAGVSGHLTLTRYIDVTDGSTVGTFDGNMVK